MKRIVEGMMLIAYMTCLCLLSGQVVVHGADDGHELDIPGFSDETTHVEAFTTDGDMNASPTGMRAINVLLIQISALVLFIVGFFLFMRKKKDEDDTNK